MIKLNVIQDLSHMEACHTILKSYLTYITVVISSITFEKAKPVAMFLLNYIPFL